MKVAFGLEGICPLFENLPKILALRAARFLGEFYIYNHLFILETVFIEVLLKLHVDSNLIKQTALLGNTSKKIYKK